MKGVSFSDGLSVSNTDGFYPSVISVDFLVFSSSDSFN